MVPGLRAPTEIATNALSGPEFPSGKHDLLSAAPRFGSQPASPRADQGHVKESAGVLSIRRTRRTASGPYGTLTCTNGYYPWVCEHMKPAMGLFADALQQQQIMCYQCLDPGIRWRPENHLSSVERSRFGLIEVTLADELGRVER
jgi:hypothetical protein